MVVTGQGDVQFKHVVKLLVRKGLEPAPTVTPTPTSAAAAVPEEPLLTLAILEGKAEHRTADTEEWSDANHGMSFEVGDHVRTLKVSTAVVNFADGSQVKLEPSTEIVVEVFDLVDGGPPDGYRIAKIRLVEGDITFDVVDAPSPPNVWEFITEDGVVAIQGTGGSLSSREDEPLEVEILEGEATVAYVAVDEDTGEAELNLVSVSEGLVVCLEGAGDEVSDEDRENLLAAGEAIALAGDEAVQAVAESGDIAAGLEVAQAILTEDPAAQDVLDALDVDLDEAEDIVQSEDIQPGDFTVALEAVAAALEEPAEGLTDASSGDIVWLASFARSLDRARENFVGPGGAAPETLEELAAALADEFVPPAETNLYDEDGDLVGVYEPETIVYDEDGDPIGKRPGAFYAVNPDGSRDEDGEVPDVFYVEGAEDLVASTISDLLPHILTGEGDLGLNEATLANLVTFDEDGNLAQAFIEYDDAGNPIGTRALTADFFDAEGGELQEIVNQILEFEDGALVGQAAIAVLLVDDQGELQEYEIPPPVVFDAEGVAIGIQAATSFVIGDDGAPVGLEVGGVLDRDFVAAAANILPEIASQVGALLEDAVVYDEDGTARTTDEFRPAQILRDEVGEVISRQIATALT